MSATPNMAIKDAKAAVSPVDGIRARHKSARPKRNNPAWMNTEHDIGVLLTEYDKLVALVKKLDCIAPSIPGPASECSSDFSRGWQAALGEAYTRASHLRDALASAQP